MQCRSGSRGRSLHLEAAWRARAETKVSLWFSMMPPAFRAAQFAGFDVGLGFHVFALFG
jgi:hypothetical protein